MAGKRGRGRPPVEYRAHGVPVRHDPELHAMAKYIAVMVGGTIGSVFDSKSRAGIIRQYRMLKAQEAHDHGDPGA